MDGWISTTANTAPTGSLSCEARSSQGADVFVHFVKKKEPRRRIQIMAKRLTMKRVRKALKNNGACERSLRWLSKQKRGLKEAILTCPEPAWVQWLYIRLIGCVADINLYDSDVSKIWSNVYYDPEYCNYEYRKAAALAMEVEYIKGLLLDRWPEVEAWLLRESEER